MVVHKSIYYACHFLCPLFQACQLGSIGFILNGLDDKPDLANAVDARCKYKFFSIHTPFGSGIGILKVDASLL